MPWLLGSGRLFWDVAGSVPACSSVMVCAIALIRSIIRWLTLTVAQHFVISMLDFSRPMHGLVESCFRASILWNFCPANCLRIVGESGSAKKPDFSGAMGLLPQKWHSARVRWIFQGRKNMLAMDSKALNHPCAPYFHDFQDP